MDGVLAIGGCDKNMPGAMIAMARLNIPAIFVYGGTIKPGRYAGKDLDIVSVFEAVGEHGAGRISRRRLRTRSSATRVPGVGSCGGMYTANTMSSAIEAMGMSLPDVVDDGGGGRREARERGAERARARRARSSATSRRATS